MRVYGWKSATAAAGIIFGVAMLLSAAPAPLRPQALPATHEIALTLDPAQTKLHFSVDSTLHTVHGTFALKSGSLKFDS